MALLLKFKCVGCGHSGQLFKDTEYIIHRCPNCDSELEYFAVPPKPKKVIRFFNESTLDNAIDGDHTTKLPDSAVNNCITISAGNNWDRLRVEDNQITFLVGENEEALRVTEDGFYVEGRPVDTDDKKVHDGAVYKVFKAWLDKAFRKR